MAYKTEAEWKAAQPDLTKITNPMEQRVALESWQNARPGYVNPMDYQTYNEYAVAANPRNKEFGTDSGQELQNQANFYGMTIENYQNALSGDPTKPMGGNQAVYGAQLLSPLEQRAAETARGQGISTMSPETLALAKANPDVFNAASQRFQNYMATTYPGTLEYENVLSGPMQFSDAGVKYPVTKDTVSMYILDPRTNQIIKNPNYKGAKQAADGGLMSLADHMSSKGRGSDSMLVHMTPEEVQSLQALALKNGGSLTINPDTGLPEANFLKKLLPIALGAFLGPAGAAIGGGFMSAGMAGLTVGGLTTLATGSLSRGLMAGLGAYGGAGLAESLTSAGTGALAAGDIAAQQAAGTFPVAPELAGMTAEQAAAATNSYASQVSGVRDMALSKAGEAGFGAKAAAGFGQVASNPGAYAKDALQYGLAAISPIMADQGVQTATKRPDTGTIRNYTFDPYGQTYTSAGNYPASEYKGMAQGGIVALAAGGPSYIDLSRDSSADQIASAYKAFTDASGGNTQQNQAAAIDYLTNLGIGQDKINQAYGKYTAGPTYTNYTQQNVLDYLQANPTVDIAAATAQTGADPRTVAQAINSLGAGYLDPTNTTGGSGAFQYYDAYTNKGIGAKELYDAKLLLDPNYSFDAQTGAAGLAAMQRAFDVAKQFDTYRYGTVGNTTLEKDIDFLKNYDAGKFTGDRTQQIEDIARETGLSLSEATRRYDAARAGMVTPPPPPPPTVCPTGFHYDPVAKACVPNISATQNTTTTVTTPTDIATAASTALPVGISGAGVTTINPNGTVTTAPNIPGRPEGGFTGMGQVRDAYTAGGGSLGYVNRAPKTIDEFNERFNKQTGDSLNAYNYLMGKGANNNAYPTKSGVAQIMRPYSEVTTGVPVAEGRPTQKYIFQGGKYVENPNYQPLSYNSKGERKVGMTTSEVLKGVQGLKDPADDGALFDWATANNISEAQLAAALGISIAEARARIAAGKTKSTGNTGNTGNTNNTDTLNDYEKLQMQSPGSANGGVIRMALGGLGALAGGGSTAQYNLGGYSDGGRLLRGPGDGVSDSIPATIGNKQPARLADGEFVIPARIVSELGNGSTEAGARKLYAMMDRVQKARGKTTGKSRVAANTRSEKYLPA